MGDYSDSHELLAVVPPVHHQRICEAFDDGALGFAEPLHGVAASGVRDVDWRSDLDVVAVSVLAESVGHFQKLRKRLEGSSSQPNGKGSFVIALRFAGKAERNF